MKIYSENRGQPRFNTKKYRYIALNVDLFERFKESNPNVDIDYSFFKGVIHSISEEIVEFAATHREGILLPSNLGRMHFALYPPKQRPEDARTIRLTGLPATHFNFNTNGFMGKIIWTFRDAKYTDNNLKYYGFRACRSFKNIASTAFRETPERFVRESVMIREQEFYKLKNARDKINSQVSDQPSEDSEQGS